MKNHLFAFLILSVSYPVYCQFSPDDYCLVWSDEFNVNGAPNTANWRYEQGYVRNNEAQYYTNGRLENARVENGRLILEARRDGWQGHEYTSASLVSWGKVVHRYGRFEMRAKIDARPGLWPAFWTLGESGEWPSNGEVDIMEYYNGKIHANVAWGTETRWQANWDSQNKNVSDFGPGWADQFHVWRMEWTPEYIHLYVDDVLMNTTNLSQTINGSISNIRNPFHQGHYILLNHAIGGNSGGDPSNTTFPARYEIDYVRVYQLGNCNLDCNWQEGGSAYLDECQQCVGGTTGRNECVLNCNGNIIQNGDFETGSLSSWSGWGTRSVTTQSFSGTSAVQVGNGAAEMVVNVSPNTKYTLEAKGRKTGGGWVRLGVKEHGSAESYKEITASSWTTMTHTFTTGNTNTARIYFYNGSGGTAYGDEFTMIQTGCTVITGISNQTQQDKRLELYPNPSETSFTLLIPEDGLIKIWDSKGRLIEGHHYEKDQKYGNALAPGLYTIQFISGTAVKTSLWVKQ